MKRTKSIAPKNENGNLHGYCELFDHLSVLRFKGNYVDDHPHGYCEDYYSNGYLQETAYYIHGKLNGLFQTYDYIYANNLNEKRYFIV